MSSREFLVLVNKLPDESEYKRFRAGYSHGVRDWTPEEYRMARLVREIAAARYDGRDAGEPDLTGLYSPLDLAYMAAEQETYDAAYNRNEDELYRGQERGD
jgi:hypothetical protein